jgi:hypothetical protein
MKFLSNVFTFMFKIDLYTRVNSGVALEEFCAACAG